MLSKNQCLSLVFHYFLSEGWLPSGTTPQNWESITMGQLGFDDPPLPGNPDLQKTRISLDLQRTFFLLGSRLADAVEQLRKDDLTLGEFAEWCFNNQGV